MPIPIGKGRLTGSRVSWSPMKVDADGPWKVLAQHIAELVEEVMPAQSAVLATMLGDPEPMHLGIRMLHEFEDQLIDVLLTMDEMVPWFDALSAEEDHKFEMMYR